MLTINKLKNYLFKGQTL